MDTKGGDLELVSAGEEGLRPLVNEMTPDTRNLSSCAAELARQLAWLPGQRAGRSFRNRCRTLAHEFNALLAALESRPLKTASADLRLLHENVFLLEGELEDTCETLKRPQKTPQVRTSNGAVPRVAALAEDFLAATAYRFGVTGFTEYIQAFQEITILDMVELWTLIPVLKLVLLEQIAQRGRRALEEPTSSHDIGNLIGSLRDIRQTTWKVVIEPLIRFDRVLRDDPAGAYSQMDYDSRELYRTKVVTIAAHSDSTEMQVASEVLALAREAQKLPADNSRKTLRHLHVGSYLLAEGVALLERRVGFQAPIADRMRSFLRQHPDEFYLLGIALLTLAIVLGVVMLLTDAPTPLGMVLLSVLALLLPSSQSAVQIMNYLATVLLPAEILPKLDFSGGLPDDCVTLVAVPTLLLNEEQVRKLADDLEVRFLGNHDPNLHFMLLTDLPDAAEKPPEDAPLVDLCSDLISGLNEKYAGKQMGSFFLLHRHPIYNPREQLWMGWERKRGKLMDLNNLLRGQFDSFPVKVGNLSTLSQVRFVITLDSDTELPRDSARRMAGALAHPLNQAIIDPEKGIVVTGYGILQPRVGVSVQSSAVSRLASVYSGQTGLDIYTRAASDVYQDLYGEGIFVGKGIYEVETLHRVLDRRFPRNALLSHDLVEGAYARAGLVSDIEVIEDYPSHYSAYNRRKHRWLRGDWQIAEWIRPLVLEESRRKVPNPLSLVSRWKIVDNLRRSMAEPALFLLLLLGWAWLPGRPWEWTLATLAIVFLPAVCQLGFGLVNAAALRKRAIALDAMDAFLNESVVDFLTITFLAHQALLSLDAMVRTLVRRMITRQRLLQWETAAQAELAGYTRTVLDIYLSWTPAFALGIFLLMWLGDRKALPAAVPILLLWACSKPISLWLNRPPRTPRKQVSEADQWLLRGIALRTWRYFAEFSTEEQHWLIPDNVQEEHTKVADRISPTNLGFLFNARQSACEFGYLTVPEFARQTLRTLRTVSHLQRHRGHLLNWYDTKTLSPLAPAFISSVDSGNLVACLWTLQQGCLELLSRPLLQPELADGFLDHLYVLATERALPRRKFAAIKRELKQKGKDGLQYLLNVPDAALGDIRRSASDSKHVHARWFQTQPEECILQIRRTARRYAPWLLPEFAGLKADPAICLPDQPDALPALERMPEFIDDLTVRLKAAADATEPGERSALCLQLLFLLPDARSHVVGLTEDLKQIASQASALTDEMSFEFLLNRSRGLLSIGFDVERQQLHPSCYDLLASESRIALFAAIAKDEIPQESWFQLGRPHTVDGGMTGLLSWTGTMFEYLMPALWMRIYPNTLLERTVRAAVRSQQAYASDKGLPWGISESAWFSKDSCDNYQYYAFGVPQLAVHKTADQHGPVVSPYSTLLALPVDSPAALRNLRELKRRQSLGTYGFYDALDFRPKHSRFRLRRFDLVRCWMAHHQGMSLLAIANFLHDDVFQRWFHSHLRVQATELLLQEKPAGHVRPRNQRTSAA